MDEEEEEVERPQAQQLVLLVPQLAQQLAQQLEQQPEQLTPEKSRACVEGIIK